jgi:hypothetical protein
MGLFSKLKQLLTLLLICCPAIAQAALTVTDRGISNNNTSEASTAMAPTTTIAAGSTGILIFGGQNAGGSSTSNTPTSITDSVGNVWYRNGNRISNVAANNGTEVALYVCYGLTTQLTSSNNVTITYTVGNVTGKCWSFMQVDSATGNVGLLSNDLTTISATGTPSISFAEEYAPGQLAIGVDCRKSGDTWTPDSDTTNGSWSTYQHTAAGTNCSMMTQWKVVTASGVQTFNPTLTSATGLIDLIRVHEVPSIVRSSSGFATGGTSTTLPLRRPIASGSIGVLAMSCDNSGSGGATKVLPNTFTDSQGNTWTQRLTAIEDPGVANAGVEVALYTGAITTPLSNVDTLNITYDAGVTVPTRNATVYEFTGSYSFIASAAAAGQNATTAPSVTSSSITSGDVIIGIVGAEGIDTFTGDSDTSNGNWSTMASVQASTGATSATALASQYKTVNGTGTQTYNPTLGTASDAIAGWMQIRQSSPTQSATNGFFSWP